MGINDRWEGLDYSGPKLDPSQLVYVGLRSVDPGEKEFIEKYSIRNYYSKDILEKGIQYVIDEIVRDYPDRKIHLSFDVDALDPKDAPSTGVPESDGLPKDHIMSFTKAMKETGNLVHLDVVEFNPKIGTQEDVKKTLKMCVDVIETAF